MQHHKQQLYGKSIIYHSIPFSDDGEDEDEQVNDIQVKIERGEDVFLWAERVLVLPSNHQLSVVNDVDAEDDRPDGSVHQADGLGAREEYRDESKEGKNHKYGQENTWITTTVNYMIQSWPVKPILENKIQLK